MKRIGWKYLVIASICSVAHAQVPELGRWQDLDFPTAEVFRQTGFQYRDVLSRLGAKGQLDDDAAVLARVRPVFARLVRAAAGLRPESASWSWEVHVSSDPSIEAFCMAGGKLVVGSSFVRRLKFDEGELASLIAHEIAHALANHPDEVLTKVRRIGPAPDSSPLEIVMSRLDADWTWQLRLSYLLSIQESEADQLGMILVHRAGWPSSHMVRFYEKLVAAEQPSLLSGGHPAAASRLSMAKGMAKLLGENKPAARRSRP